MLLSAQFSCKFQVHQLEALSPFHCILQSTFSLALGQKNGIPHMVLSHTMFVVVLHLILKRTSIFFYLVACSFYGIIKIDITLQWLDGNVPINYYIFGGTRLLYV